MIRAALLAASVAVPALTPATTVVACHGYTPSTSARSNAVVTNPPS
jgi:hypothetical protein